MLFFYFFLTSNISGNRKSSEQMRYEPLYEKNGFLHAVTAKLISAFVFAIRIVQSFYYLNPKFQASSHLLWLYSPVCVGPGQKPRKSVFSQRGSFKNMLETAELIAILFLTVFDLLSSTPIKFSIALPIISVS